ncbi:hypothetical protein CLV58_10360 [Spirosoma oryzae]|uniref:Methyltransferase family protein n=1 Tax=Spirosoma oryzae TaxID=1469603 RepID=A0A2T0TEL0_9BACT|nr:class I SAM-dependent methyltransferase [Spirosoma oryzae]PRY44091.1 hypothetical protein CLV58_10360 [Spirosoma oryzae]
MCFLPTNYLTMANDATDWGDAETIFRYHKRLIDQYGAGTTRAQGWRSFDGQRARFDVLCQIANLSGHSVLDAGCGHADLFPFLTKRFSSLTYYGCEQIPDLLDVAIQRYRRASQVTLLPGDFLADTVPMTDFVLASGSLNYRHSDARFIYKAIETLFDNCRIGLGFNLLSGGVEAGNLLQTYDPEDISSFCERLAKSVTLRTGYWPDDFTLFLYK